MREDDVESANMFFTPITVEDEESNNTEVERAFPGCYDNDELNSGQFRIRRSLPIIKSSISVDSSSASSSNNYLSVSPNGSPS